MSDPLHLTSTEIRASDGTDLAYHSIGEGPGIVIVHGAMQSALSQLDLAGILADQFQVHLMDRRGRGASGPYPGAAGTDVEVGDLRAVLSATGARRVFGISSGAIIAARTALVDPAITRLALFEPPVSLNGSMRLELGTRMDAAFATGDLATGMAVAMKISEMGPPWMFGLPVPVLAAASRRMLTSDDLRALAEALPVDFRIVRENADRLADFASITAPTLLIDGTATRPFLRKAVGALTHTIPHAQHIELVGQMHAVTQNRTDRGRPETIAPALRRFFAEAGEGSS